MRIYLFWNNEVKALHSGSLSPVDLAWVLLVFKRNLGLYIKNTSIFTFKGLIYILWTGTEAIVSMTKFDWYSIPISYFSQSFSHNTFELQHWYFHMLHSTVVYLLIVTVRDCELLRVENGSLWNILQPQGSSSVMSNKYCTRYMLSVIS